MDSSTDISQLCRLCLLKDKVNTPIFEGQGDIGHVYKKISSLLPVKVAEDDKLPKSICDSCTLKLDMFYEFWQMSGQSEKKLLEWLNETEPNNINQPTETIVKQEAIDINDKLEVFMNVPTYGQDFFEETTTTVDEPQAKRPKRATAAKASATLHETDDEDDPSETLTKMEDESEGTEGEDQESAIVNVPSTSADSQPGPSGVGKESSEAPCLESSILKNLVYGPGISIIPIKKEVEFEEHFENLEEFENRNILASSDIKSESRVKTVKRKGTRNKDPHPQDLDDPVKCDICNVTYKNNVAFALHSIEHNEDAKFSCHLCNYRNTSKYHIAMHIRAHQGNTKYKCEICGKAFTVSTHAIEHKYFHTGEKPFGCEICGKHFMFSWFLTSHRRTQHWEIMTGSPLVKYDCTICNKHYTSSTGLRRHNLSKHNTDGVDLSVLCDICGKRLSSKEKLKFHRRIHTGYKPYSCGVCSKSFSRKEQLKEHERVHTGEKPYICKYCGKGFSQRSPLRIHERTHTGERPYVCMICSKGFISKGVMDTHMKTCKIF